MLCDKDTFIEIDKDLRPIDPLEFVDKKSYKKRIQESEEKTGRASSVIAGEALVGGIEMQLVLFDFAFMGGSLGSVEVKKLCEPLIGQLLKSKHL